MGKIWVEICLISARGVRGSVLVVPTLWKRQWYAVGWVDPNTKYCTKFDSASTNANPVWRTKFSFQIDDNNELNKLQEELALNVEVYSRDPVFLTEKLHGTATILLKEFLTKKLGNEEVGSYQLRNKKSNKPKGFIDVSFRVLEDKHDPSSSQFGDDEGGIRLPDHGGNKPYNMATTHGGFGQGYRQQQQQQQAPPSFHGPEKHPQTNVPNYSNHQVPFPTNYSNPYVGGPSYYHAPLPPPPHQPPPPRPPLNAGYFPNFFPSNDGGSIGPSYINMPSSSAAAAPNRQRGPPPAGFAVGAGAGALAAGAVMFGDDHLMSGFGVGGDPTIAIATDPLF